MSTSSQNIPDSERTSSYLREFLHNKKVKLSLSYSLLLITLYAASWVSPMDNKGLYVQAIILLNLIGITAFYLQFPLVGRLKHLPLFNQIDWSVAKHKTVGYWIGGIFFLHPFLIMAPKLLLSQSDAWLALRTTITAPELLTGLIAWVLLAVWVIFSALKNKLAMRYEIWRFFHSLGFIVITILATIHITSVGSHGQLQQAFNTAFWVLCALSISGTIYNYAIKPAKLSQSPFEVTALKKVSTTDWQLTITPKNNTDFHFEAGQFVWINTHPSAYHLDYHPFSIASSANELPNLSFIIRELGDYTQQLDTLSVGQTVYVDGPFGQMNLRQTHTQKAITLIAGGAGIGPMLSLLRQLADNQDPRPIRLIYGNTRFNQISMQNEIKQLEATMPNFKQILVCNEHVPDENVHQGVISQALIHQTLFQADLGISNKDWGIYLCGPQGMIDSVLDDLLQLNVSKNHIHFEQLSF